MRYKSLDSVEVIILKDLIGVKKGTKVRATPMVELETGEISYQWDMYWFGSSHVMEIHQLRDTLIDKIINI
jgi:hypothetical protein